MLSGISIQPPGTGLEKVVHQRRGCLGGVALSACFGEKVPAQRIGVRWLWIGKEVPNVGPGIRQADGISPALFSAGVYFCLCFCQRGYGFIGKTVIHPNQIPVVNECLKVSPADYQDACRILNWDPASPRLVLSSAESTRMNEYNTHFHWADRIIQLARVYGIKAEPA